ncbi:ImuA family protein [Pseudoroseicyclus aestuarii]|uniref:Protein ImuA n=1 Tax=Pseudoroseicyclus aestuarii TaxID=1795041 RepID=A0A318SRT6_9RHOB|nr:hypothetical protein [Pseudoroseicyclus aestuarii]PYE81189.1 protein ImuA [Pseudoroseicyclus aestuarii]
MSWSSSSPPLSSPSSAPEDRSPTLSEIFAETSADAAAPAFALAHLGEDTRPLLWIQDRMSRREAGRVNPPGLAEFGARPLLMLEVARPVDVLWAMEQGLDTPALCAVIGEVWGDPPALDFTATKRLALRAEAHGVHAWLIRRGARADLSAARERWRIASLPARADPFDSRAPGAPLWQADLFRARWRAPGAWVAGHERGSGQQPRLVLEHAISAPPAAAASGMQRARHA